MKIVLQILTLIAILSGISFASDTANWVLIARSANHKDFFIDSKTLSYQLIKLKMQMSEEQVATAWFKIVPGKEAKQTVSLTEKYINDEVGYATVLIQTNCANSMLRVLVINIFDKDGKISHRIETLTSKYEGIPPRTVFNDIKDIICR
ncbi:MAG: hypothetical protein HQL08_05260 [Nitrospirae bacterium]|nr:hypothetical protein [Nitrospirota bacterium]